MGPKNLNSSQVPKWSRTEGCCSQTSWRKFPQQHPPSVLQEAHRGKKAEDLVASDTPDLKPSSVTLGILPQKSRLTVLSLRATIYEMGTAMPPLTQLLSGLRAQMQVKDLAKCLVHFSSLLPFALGQASRPPKCLEEYWVNPLY